MAEHHTNEGGNLSPQQERLLGLLKPRRSYHPYDLEEEFYGMAKGSYGYVNAGRGRGGGSLKRTFQALERRGLVIRDRDGQRWRLA